MPERQQNSPGVPDTRDSLARLLERGRAVRAGAHRYREVLRAQQRRRKGDAAVVRAKNYYSGESLGRVLANFEERYGRTSEEFYAEHEASVMEPIAGVPAFHRHVWASFYKDFKRLHGDEFAENAERVLA